MKRYKLIGYCTLFFALGALFTRLSFWWMLKGILILDPQLIHESFDHIWFMF